VYNPHERIFLWLNTFLNDFLRQFSFFVNISEVLNQGAKLKLATKNENAGGYRPLNWRVLILTEEFAVDLGRFLRWGNPTVPCLWPVTDVFHFKYVRASSVVLCVCVCVRERERQLYFVLLYICRRVHKFDFWLAIKETPDDWWPLEIRPNRQDLYVFLRPSSPVFWESTFAKKVKCILLCKLQYIRLGPRDYYPSAARCR